MKAVSGFSVGAFFILAATLGAAPSFATTLTYSAYSVIDEQNVTINALNGNTIDGGNSITGGAGEIVLHGTNSVDYDVFCVDIFDWLLNGGTFTSTDNSIYDGSGATSSPGALTNGQIGEIGALMMYYRGHQSNGDINLSAAIQVAIWETEYGTSDWQFVSSAGVAADVTALLDMNLPADDAWVALVSDPGSVPDNQTQALLVSEPASLSVFLAALVALSLPSVFRSPQHESRRMSGVSRRGIRSGKIQIKSI